MPLYINTLGLASAAVAVCDRCKMKRSITELVSDPNAPGVRACKDRGCIDQFDPYRLPARQTENITLRYPRPDLPLTGFDQDGLPIETEDGADLLTEFGEVLET